MKRATTIDASTVPRLAARVKLRYDSVRACWVLHAPDEVLLPDETALAVLRRLDGESSVAAIAQAMAKDYDASPDEIATDVLEMLQELAEKGLVRA